MSPTRRRPRRKGGDGKPPQPQAKAAPAAGPVELRNDRLAATADMWRAVPEPPPAEKIHPATDPTAVLRSLGAPPVVAQGIDGERNLMVVVARSAQIATALAAAAGLLADPTDD